MSGSNSVEVEAIQSGFSAMAAEYDSLAGSHPIVIWMRGQIRKMVEQELPAGGSILEINCGSGLDAAYFAAKGFRVHATDIAPGMLESLAEKARQPKIEGELLLSSYPIRNSEQLPVVLTISSSPILAGSTVWTTWNWSHGISPRFLSLEGKRFSLSCRHSVPGRCCRHFEATPGRRSVDSLFVEPKRTSAAARFTSGITVQGG